MNTSGQHDASSQNQRPSPEKRRWKTPQLDVIGDVVELTKGPSGGTVDILVGGSGGFEDGPPDIS